MINKAAITGSLLQHAGHLSEWAVFNDYYSINFERCVKYVVYNFFNNLLGNSFINELTTTAHIHKRHIINNHESHINEIAFESPQWINMIIKPNAEIFIKDIQNIETVWSSWRPSDTTVKKIKYAITRYDYNI